MVFSAQALNTGGLTAFPALFAALPPPDFLALPGFYRAEFVGPRWLRAIAPRGLALTHLRGWWGKELREDCTGANLVVRGQALQRSLRIHVTTQPSLLDGKSVVAIRYTADCPFPWPHVVDELRQIDALALLGMTIVNAGFLRRLPLPFVLHREDRPHGL